MSKLALRTIAQPVLNAIPDDLLPRLEPAYVENYNKYNAGRLHTHQIPIEWFRAAPQKYVVQWGRADGGEVAHVSQQNCPVDGGEICVRIFEPENAYDKSTAARRAVYVNYHGGGFCFGDLEMDDPFCRRICREVGCVVFDVEYRLSPVHQFPVPLDDCWRALNWIQTEKADEFHLDINKTAIGGVSAGGHLSAVLGLMARDAGIPLAFQLLVVPAVDLTSLTPDGRIADDCPYQSFPELTETPALPTERVAHAYNHYLGVPRPEGWKEDWRISPIKASSFKGLAPALVVTAELCPLRDEGAAYVKRLRGNGVPVEHIMYERVPHPFMMHDAVLDAGKKYQVDTVRALREAFGV